MDPLLPTAAYHMNEKFNNIKLLTIFINKDIICPKKVFPRFKFHLFFEIFQMKLGTFRNIIQVVKF